MFSSSIIELFDNHCELRDKIRRDPLSKNEISLKGSVFKLFISYENKPEKKIYLSCDEIDFVEGHFENIIKEINLYCGSSKIELYNRENNTKSFNKTSRIIDGTFMYFDLSNYIKDNFSRFTFYPTIKNIPIAMDDVEIQVLFDKYVVDVNGREHNIAYHNSVLDTRCEVDYKIYTR